MSECQCPYLVSISAHHNRPCPKLTILVYIYQIQLPCFPLLSPAFPCFPLFSPVFPCFPLFSPAFPCFPLISPALLLHFSRFTFSETADILDSSYSSYLQSVSLCRILCFAMRQHMRRHILI